MAHLRFKFTGIAPLLIHNEQLANPFNAITKEMKKVSAVRKKTDDEYEQLAKIEFKGGLYIDPNIGPFVPGTWVDGLLVNSAKKERLGEKFKSYSRCVEDRLPIQYAGPRVLEKMWDAGFYDQRLVKVEQKKLLRTRPCFREWALECTVMFDEQAIDPAQVIRAVERGGASIGLGDYRPRFGRFNIEVSEDGAATKKAA